MIETTIQTLGALFWVAVALTIVGMVWWGDYG
jgi:hypothetical protein